jgi:L-asparaginase II
VGAAPLVRIVRSGLVESVHLGHAAVCDAEGRLVAYAGDPTHPFYLRSCAKPFQAAVSFCAIDEPLPDDLAAVVCSSHNGEPVHVRAVRAVLRRAGLDPSALHTPPGFPLDPASARRARDASTLLHNCSGKHAGMLLASVRAGWPTETYPRRSHPLQRRVACLVRAAAGVDVTVGVDGCGVPVHGMPLAAIATAYARLATPDRFEELAPSVARSTAAMRAEPYLVGGRGRVDTSVMEVADRLVVKEGAEALVCAVDLGSRLGVAVKIADGGERATGPALVSVLRQADLVSEGQVRSLRSIGAPPVRGGSRRVGSLEAIVELRSARA